VPTYQYTCTECGEPVEAVQKFSDAPLTVCSNCGGRLRKVFSPVGIVFKGSGFYRTDSRKNGVVPADSGSKDKDKDKSSSSGDSGSSSSTSSESSSAGGASADKPAAKKSETVAASAKSSSSTSSEKVA
jgi:putative FmdB family regulatory protein